MKVLKSYSFKKSKSDEIISFTFQFIDISNRKNTEQPSATAISTLSTRQRKLNRRHRTAMKHQETEQKDARRHGRNNHKDTKLEMSSLLVFIRVYRLEIQSVMLVSSTVFVDYSPLTFSLIIALYCKHVNSV